MTGVQTCALPISLLRILAGLSRASEGSVRIFGADVRKTETRHKIGVLGHGISLYDELTAIENLTIFAKLYNLENPTQTARQWLERVGLDRVRDGRVREFSRGMRQRLAVARVSAFAQRGRPGAVPRRDRWLGTRRDRRSVAAHERTHTLRLLTTERIGQMTRTARELGMTRTQYRNPSGLPNPGQVTTARDIATLSLRIQRDFPEYYGYFKIPSFVFRGQTITTHTKLIGRFQGTDEIGRAHV